MNKEEIEQTIKGLQENQETAIKLLEENVRLKRIIKEVREYIKNIPDDEFVESEHFTELLEILEGDKNE